MNATKDVYILFFGSNTLLGLNTQSKTFLHEDFQHVKCIMRDTDHPNWTCIAPRYDRLILEQQKDLNDENIKSTLKELGPKVIRVRVGDDESKDNISLNFINLINCVSIAKYCIGLHSWVQTPRQLFKKLVRMAQTDCFCKSILDVEIIKGD